MAEKLRAALTRKDIAIRDFFDVDHAVRNDALDPTDATLLTLLRQKLLVPGSGLVDVSPSRLGQLQQQLVPDLQPVLREHDFEQFNLERAIEIVRAVARHLPPRAAGTAEIRYG